MRLFLFACLTAVMVTIPTMGMAAAGSSRIE